MGGACSAYGGKRGVCKFSVGNLQGKRTLGRPRLRLEDNIKIDTEEVRCGLWTGWSCHRIGTHGGYL